MSLPNIRSLSQQEMIDFFAELGEPAYRAKQTHQWLWQKHVRSFEDMTNLGKDLRSTLQAHFSLEHLEPATVQQSKDGTVKSAMRLPDGKIVESVLIPAGKRMTACVSSQVGCSLDCAFCATAALKRMRNLEPDEIYDQVVTLNQQAGEFFNQRLSNIVFMGMGEPLLNYTKVMESIAKITSPEGLGMSPKRITLSTSGVAKMMHRMAEEEVPFHLALSLHAANDEKRTQLMSINATNPLSALAEALRHWHQSTGRRVTYEFIVFKDFNDSPQDARELVDFSRIVPCKINLIEYNPIEGGSFEQTTPERFERFVGILEAAGCIVNVRRSRGKDIDAACGQLANKTP